MEILNALLGGIAAPLVLLAAGAVFGVRLGWFWLLHPIRTGRALREAASSGGTPPAAALTLALAGTLGVGNIAGVATAVTAGGPGAVFWMLVGGVAAMGVKYAEVYLAVRWRRARTEGGRTVYRGGAMIYLRDGLGARARTPRGRRAAAALGTIFAVLCAVSALTTGNVVQVHAAAQCVTIPPPLFGLLFAAAAAAAVYGGADRTAHLTAVMIPLLAALFLALSGVLICAHAARIPLVLARIWRGAWEARAAGGGLLGFGVHRAIRFGITRGIFSNEAGCGTSPTAHAAAAARSPYHQGCFGIFEVFADTIVLCSVTALVILLYADGEGLDGIELALTAYTRLAFAVGGASFARAVDWLLRVSILLFAYATVIAQSSCGAEALSFAVGRARARTLFLPLSAAASFAGAMLRPRLIWASADFVIALMTVVNCLALCALRRQVGGPPQNPERGGSGAEI